MPQTLYLVNKKADELLSKLFNRFMRRERRYRFYMKHSVNQTEQVLLIRFLDFRPIVLSLRVLKQRGIAAALFTINLLVISKTRFPKGPFTAASLMLGVTRSLSDPRSMRTKRELIVIPLERVCLEYRAARYC